MKNSIQFFQKFLLGTILIAQVNLSFGQAVDIHPSEEVFSHKQSEYALLAAKIMTAAGWAIFLGSWACAGVSNQIREIKPPVDSMVENSMLAGFAMAQLGLIGIAIASKNNDHFVDDSEVDTAQRIVSCR